MSKSVRICLILSTAFLTTAFASGCASVDKTEEQAEFSADKYAADHCKFLGGLFKDQNLNDALAVVDPNGGGGGNSIASAETPKEKFTWPWDKGIEAKASRDRAKIRKAHKQKGCAE